MNRTVPCQQPGCTGSIAADGYCDTCGAKASTHAPVAASPPPSAPAPAPTPAVSAPVSRPSAGTLVTGSAHARGSRRTSTAPTSGRTSARTGGIGAGIVDVPPAPAVDPSTVVLADAVVPVDKRFCSNCGAPVGRPRPDAPEGRTSGVCSQCRHHFDFQPKLTQGDMVGGQYEVVGPLAHGGLGWIYLARDKAVNDRWVVLKGLLDSGDEAAMQVALAERRFLAELSHPSIVGIFNFVTAKRSGYIVEEYVGGKSLKQLLAARRAAKGAVDPLPVHEALAFILAILPAFTYLHDNGLLYCDFKPDNLIQVGDHVKLIDLGAVRRVDDTTSDVYGTVGYQAPEIADMGPSVASDIYTLGRTLAVLTLDFRGYQKQYADSLPDPADHPVLARFDSFYRLVLKATARHPDDRFQSVGELGQQMVGVLREVVALTTGQPQPAASTIFGPPPDDESVPRLAVNSVDPAATFLANLPSDNPEAAMAQLRDALAAGTVTQSVEVRLRTARALLELGDVKAATAELDATEQADPWEWRAVWLRGVMSLQVDDLAAATAAFDRCRSEVPGELAPKLAAAITAERAGDARSAVALYETVVATDPSYVTAARGLARCRAAAGDVAGALAAFDRVPAYHRAHADAQAAAVRVLIAAGRFAEAGDRLARAVDLSEEEHAEIEGHLYESALRSMTAGGGAGSVTINGRVFTERAVRLQLEAALRRQARLASSDGERLALIDRANRRRPFTLL